MTEIRPERIEPQNLQSDFIVHEEPLGLAEWLFAQSWFRKILLILLLVACWEVYARWLDNPLLLPTFSATLQALVKGIGSGVLLERTAASMRILAVGFSLGMLIAAMLTVLAVWSRWGADALETLTAMFNPLPAIALLPLALIWFGLGAGSIYFVIVHSVLWAVSLNTYSGFKSVSRTLRMVGQNYGLRGLGLVVRILVPAAFPSILSGLKIGWAFSWRTLIAAELVFGVTSGAGGLGWYIFENKNMLNIAEVFAGLLTIIVIGLFVDSVIFRFLERHTVMRWGMA